LDVYVYCFKELAKLDQYIRINISVFNSHQPYDTSTLVGALGVVRVWEQDYLSGKNLVAITDWLECRLAHYI